MKKKILVCMKAVPVSVAVPVDSKYHLDREGVGLEWNPADLSALEAALRLKKEEGEVVVLTMGPQKIEKLLKDLFPLGVDRAILLFDRAMAGADTFATARTLKAAAEKLGPFDLIFLGRRAIDGETGQVAASLAANMDLPAVSDVEKIEEQDGELLLSRRLENGILKLSCKEKVVVMGHSLADVDSFGAAIGIYKAADSLGKKVNIVVNDISVSVRPFYDAFKNNSAYPEHLFITSYEAEQLADENTMVIVVDTNKPKMTECEALLDIAKTIVVNKLNTTIIIKNTLKNFFILFLLI